MVMHSDGSKIVSLGRVGDATVVRNVTISVRFTRWLEKVSWEGK